MDGKLVIVTGGGKGLGLAITEQLLNEGYSIIVASRTTSDELSDLEILHKGRLRYEALDMNEITCIHEWCRLVIRGAWHTIRVDKQLSHCL